jgi:hypothetical protein
MEVRRESGNNGGRAEEHEVDKSFSEHEYVMDFVNVAMQGKFLLSIFPYYLTRC